MQSERKLEKMRKCIIFAHTLNHLFPMASCLLGTPAWSKSEQRIGNLYIIRYEELNECTVSVCSLVSNANRPGSTKPATG